MKYSPVVFAIAVTFFWSQVYATDSYEYTKTNVLSKSEFEEAKLLSRLLIEMAPESVKPVFEEKFDKAFTTKWKSSLEFDKYVTGFLNDLEDQFLDDSDKFAEPRTKREASYGSPDFYKGIYALYIVMNANEADRKLLKENLIEAQKMRWDSLEEYKEYCDAIRDKIVKQNDNYVDY